MDLRNSSPDASHPSDLIPGTLEHQAGIPSDLLECAVCLQKCVHPVQLDCQHIFCFLCVKGVAIQSKRCPMCRTEIPADYLEKPRLVNPKAIGKDTSNLNILWKFTEALTRISFDHGSEILFFLMGLGQWDTF